jgi:gluconolactonase
MKTLRGRRYRSRYGPDDAATRTRRRRPRDDDAGGVEREMVTESSSPEVLAAGLGFAEGPVVLRDGSVLVTALDQGRLVRIDPAGRCTSIPVGGAPNGAAEGPGGVVFVAQCGSSSPAARAGDGAEGGLQRVDPDGTVRYLSTAPTSPNDLCVGPDGLLYCTDPTRPLGAGDGRLWRCDPSSGDIELLATLDWYPNGIGFGAEDDALYVARTGEQQIVRYPLGARGLGRPEVAVQLEQGHPDGFAFDVEGRVVVAAVRFGDDGAGDLQTWSLDGELLDVVRPGTSRLYTNVAIDDAGRMVVTESEGGTVIRCDHGTPGLTLHPFR